MKRCQSIGLCSLALLGFLAPSVAGFGQEPKSDSLQSGIDLLRRQKYDDAARQLEAGLAANPKEEKLAGQFLFYLALSRQKQAESLEKEKPEESKRLLAEAQKTLLRATQLRPKSAGSWNNLGLVSKKLGDSSGALEAFQKAIALQTSEQATYLANCAELLWEQKKFEDANRYCQAAVERDPQQLESRAMINRYYLEKLRTKLVFFAFKRFEQGQTDWAQELALKGLTTSQNEAESTQLLACIARCLARQNYVPAQLPKQVAEVLNTIADSNLKWKEGAKELLTLHQFEQLAPESYRWWSSQVNLEAPLNELQYFGWPAEAFSELAVSLGQRFEQAEGKARAEQLYKLAFGLCRERIDPNALIRLADFYVKSGQKKDLIEFFEEWREPIFDLKKHADLYGDKKRLYEIHRALAMVYVRLDQWSTNPEQANLDFGEFRNAKKQIETALEDAQAYNASLPLGAKPIGDWTLVDIYARHLEKTEPANAFAFRVNSATKFREQNLGAQVAPIVDPILTKGMPGELDPMTKANFIKLKEASEKGMLEKDRLFDPNGSKTLRIETDKGPRTITIGAFAQLGDDSQKVPELFKSLIEGSQAADPAKPVIAANLPVQLLAKDLGTKTVDKVKFDGKKGSLDLKVNGKAVQVPFSIEGPAGAEGIKSFHFIRP